MESGNVIALASTGLAAVVAVWVPRLAFRFALRQEQMRWLREHRAQLYSDLLTEAYAEAQFLEHTQLPDEIRESAQFTDLRLPPMERAQLGSRAHIFGSPEVIRSFMRIEQIGFSSGIGRRSEEQAEAHRLQTRIAVTAALEKLQDTIRRELGPDHISL